MNPRERVLTTLAHKEPDKVPIDLGGTLATGVMGMAYNQLKAYLGIRAGRTRIYDFGQQLAEPEIDLLKRLGTDTLSISISEPKKWKKSTLPDGSPCEVPGSFNPEASPDGSQILRNSTGRAVAKMPKNGYYFDPLYHPLQKISTIKGLESEWQNIYSTMWSPTLINDSILNDLRKRVKHLYQTTDYTLVLNGVGGIYEWAQLLRGWDTFMMDLVTDEKFAGFLLDRLVEENIKKLEKILPVVKRYVQVIYVNDDLGTQTGPQLSPQLYREVVKPRHKRFYQYIKKHSNAYLLLHSCGSVYEFIPDFIEMGVDALNPIQVSAKDMDTHRLKREFGKDITFWGGGCDTQKVLPFGTPKEVVKEVKRRIKDCAPGGGFVFAPVHNIQANVPPENIVAMYSAVERHGKY